MCVASKTTTDVVPPHAACNNIPRAVSFSVFRPLLSKQTRTKWLTAAKCADPRSEPHSFGLLQQHRSHWSLAASLLFWLPQYPHPPAAAVDQLWRHPPPPSPLIAPKPSLWRTCRRNEMLTEKNDLWRCCC